MGGLADVKLPEGKILIPGVIAHTTNVVEHPELVAMRLKNYAPRRGQGERDRRDGLRLLAGLERGAGASADPVGEAQGAVGRSSARVEAALVTR